MERATTTAWWLEEGSEECPFCLQSYHYEVEVRCVDCDRPTCPQCGVRVRVRHELHCPDCCPEPAPRLEAPSPPARGKREGDRGAGTRGAES